MPLLPNANRFNGQMAVVKCSMYTLLSQKAIILWKYVSSICSNHLPDSISIFSYLFCLDYLSITGTPLTFALSPSLSHYFDCSNEGCQLCAKQEHAPQLLFVFFSGALRSRCTTTFRCTTSVLSWHHSFSPLAQCDSFSFFWRVFSFTEVTFQSSTFHLSSWWSIVCHNGFALSDACCNDAFKQ